MSETTAYNVQQAVEDWGLSMSLLEINNCLSQLELQREGSLFAKLDRITKWLLGTYAPQDFVEPEGPGDVIARRKTLRDEFLR